MRIASPWLMLSAAFLVLAAGCAEEPPAPPPAPSQKVAAPPPQPAVAPEPEAAAEPVPVYAYDPANRRDPFEPLVMIRNPIINPDAPLTPLQTFETGQLRLIGVITGKGAPRAMVTAPDGKSYILQRGVLVGKNNGVVTDIRQEVVLVEERYQDFTGEVRTGIQEIRLPKREGVL